MFDENTHFYFKIAVIAVIARHRRHLAIGTLFAWISPTSDCRAWIAWMNEGFSPNHRSRAIPAMTAIPAIPLPHAPGYAN